MGFLDRLLGREERPQRETGHRAAQSDDERAVERYRYLLRTAPPEQVEQAHAEAFEKLTPAQRRQVLTELGRELPEGERARSDSPRDLARTATRAEMRQPGTLERSFGGRGGAGTGTGMGAVVGGSLLASVAGAFVGTAIAGAMLDGLDGDEHAEGDEDGARADDAAGGEEAGDPGGAGYDDGSGDWAGGGDVGGFDV